jgi:hypothetical protein
MPDSARRACADADPRQDPRRQLHSRGFEPIGRSSPKPCPDGIPALEVCRKPSFEADFTRSVAVSHHPVSRRCRWRPSGGNVVAR